MNFEKEKMRRILGVFIFALFSIVLLWITPYFGLELALPGFLVSLLFIWALPKARYSKFKNVVSSYIIVIGFGILAGHGFLNKINDINLLISPSIIALSITMLVSALIMVILSVEHPPAIAALVFFTAAEQTAKSLVGFLLCFGILICVHCMIFAIRKVKGRGLGLGEYEDEFEGEDETKLPKKTNKKPEKKKSKK